MYAHFRYWNLILDYKVLDIHIFHYRFFQSTILLLFKLFESLLCKHSECNEYIKISLMKIISYKLFFFYNKLVFSIFCSEQHTFTTRSPYTLKLKEVALDLNSFNYLITGRFTCVRLVFLRLFLLIQSTAFPMPYEFKRG